MAKTKTQKRADALARLIEQHGEPQHELLPTLTQVEIEAERNRTRQACKDARLQFDERTQAFCEREARARMARKEKGWSDIDNLRKKMQGSR